MGPSPPPLNSFSIDNGEAKQPNSKLIIDDLLSALIFFLFFLFSLSFLCLRFPKQFEHPITNLKTSSHHVEYHKQQAMMLNILCCYLHNSHRHLS